MTLMDLPAGLSLVDTPMRGIKVDTDLCTGLVFEHGAHVVEWTPKSAKHPVLWMSEKSDYADDKPIRGGVPVIYPWFGGGKDGDQQPGHGFARLGHWRLVEASVTERGAAHLVFRLGDTAGLPGVERYPKTSVEMHISLGAAFQQSLVVVAGKEPIEFEDGLHTYFAVGDINKVSVVGLDGETYTNNLNGERIVQDGPITFDAETDIRFDSVKNPRIIDDEWGREISIAKAGSKSTVVWNPWVDKSAAMPDFGDDEWPGMVCVEAANARDMDVHLKPGERHMLSQVVTVRYR